MVETIQRVDLILSIIHFVLFDVIDLNYVAMILLTNKVALPSLVQVLLGKLTTDVKSHSDYVLTSPKILLKLTRVIVYYQI